MATFTAQNILDENKYATSDIALTRAEDLIDQAITYINLETGLAIAKMAGSAGSKTATVTDNQLPIVKACASIYVRGHIGDDPVAQLDEEKSGESKEATHTEFLKGVVTRGIVLLRSLRRKGVT